MTGLLLGDGVRLVLGTGAGEDPLALVVRAILPDRAADADADGPGATQPVAATLTVTGAALGADPDDLQPLRLLLGPGDALASTLRAVALDLAASAGALGEHERARLGALLVRLTAALLVARPVASWPDPEPRRLLRLRVVLDVRAHLGDTGLGAGAVARRLGVSERSVHAAFAERQESVGRLVRRLRTERARLDLATAADGAAARPAIARRWSVPDLQ